MAGVSIRVLADRFGIGRSSVAAHVRNHLTQQQRAAILAARKPSPIDPDQLAEQEGAGLLAGLVMQRTRLLADADTCRGMGDIEAAVRAEGAVLQNYTTVAKLIGKLTNRIDVRHFHALLSPEWLDLRVAIMSALRPFPDAMRAVAATVQRREGDAARQINPPKPAPVVIEHEPVLPACPVPLP